MTGGIVVIQNGQIAQQGAPRELFESPASEFIADFIGEANVIDCEVVSVGTDTVQIRVGGLLQNLSAPNARTGPAKLAVRANAITVTAATGADLPGQIVSSAYLGDHVEYEIDGPLGRLFSIDTEAETPLAAGTAVAIGFRNRGLALFP